MKRLPWFEILLIIIFMSISFYAALSDSQNLSQNWFMRDDAYYYFKVAQNISEGRGSTFDGINPTNGYHPLWMLICIPIFALARFDLVLPLRVLLFVMSGLTVTTGILLYRLLGKIFTPFIGALTALYWVFDLNVFQIVYKQGLETGVAAFCIVLFLYNLYEFETTWRTKDVTKHQLITLGLLATLTMFSRLDLVFFADMAGIWIIFRKQTLRYYLPLDVIAIIVSVLLAFTVRFGFPVYFENTTTVVYMLAVALLIRLPMAYFLGLHHHIADGRPLNFITRLLVFTLGSSTAIGLTMLVLAGILQFPSMPRTIFLMDALFSLILIGFTRLLHRGLHGKSTVQVPESPVNTLRDNWKHWLTEGSIYYGIVLGSLSIYMLWNKLTIGSFSPVSGEIKRWWGTFLISFYGKYPNDVLSFFGIYATGDESAWQPLAGALGSLSQHISSPIYINDEFRYAIILLLFLFVSYLILRSDRQKARTAIAHLGILPLFCSCILQTISYQATGYSAERSWYWIGELITIVLFISLLLGLLASRMPSTPISPTIAWGIVAAFGFFMGLSFLKNVQKTMPYDYWSAEAPYDYFIPVLEPNTEPGSIIGMTGGGATAYFITDRTIVNMDGLINSPGYFQNFKNGTAIEYLQALGVDYVFLNNYVVSSRPYSGMFDPYIEETGVRYGNFELFKFAKTQ